MKYGYDMEFLNSDTELRSYFLGLYVADGWRSGHRRSIYISLSDYDLIEQVVELTQYTNKIHSRCNKSFTTQERTGKIQYTLTYGGPVFDAIVELGFPVVKTGNEFIPSGISDITFPHFVRGLSDGDGCFNILPNGLLRWILSSKSESFLFQLGNCLRDLSVVAKLPVANKSHGCMSYQIAHTDAIRLGHWMYDDCNIALNRKRAVWLSGCDRESAHKGWTKTELELLKSGIEPIGRTHQACIAKRYYLRKQGLL